MTKPTKNKNAHEPDVYKSWADSKPGDPNYVDCDRCGQQIKDPDSGFGVCEKCEDTLCQSCNPHWFELDDEIGYSVCERCYNKILHDPEHPYHFAAYKIMQQKEQTKQHRIKENTMSDIKTFFTTHDAPWDIVQYDAKGKELRTSGRYYGVDSKHKQRIASYVKLETATLIAVAPEMAVLIERIAKDNQSEYQYEAQLLLKMMAVQNLVKGE